jgi:hypothetical protein
MWDSSALQGLRRRGKAVSSATPFPARLRSGKPSGVSTEGRSQRSPPLIAALASATRRDQQKVTAPWTLPSPVSRFVPGFPGFLLTDLLPGGSSLFRMLTSTLLCFNVAYFDVTISAFNSGLRPGVECLSWDFQRSPLRRLQPKSPLPRRHCCLCFGTSRTTARPRSAFTVFHRPDGFRLSDPARLLHRASNHGVSGVLMISRPSPRQTVPPFEVFSPFLAVLSRYA